MKGPYTYNSSLRFLGHKALSLGYPLLAAKIWQRSKEGFKRRDAIAMVDVLCQFNGCKGARYYLLNNVDKMMPNWTRENLARQLKQIKKVYGEQPYSSGPMAQVEERMMFKDEPWKIKIKKDPCPFRPIQ